eukprot:gnl/Spiro4/15907_TR8552_c0_g1_i1.p1 gnl/Spiro4/15907_TR8552_c0_g1~~gnl/Spiro4/15907_TR8552_c0_g1_i1.p1  ORF type:complete len:328 (+),score=65.92 gnl/Spiro4/15907_TR8552_c0_g1_i1:30-986(+)
MAAAPKNLRHFSNPAVVSELLAEIKNRHPGGYSGLVASLVTQIRDFFEREFGALPAESQTNIVRPRLIVPLSGGLDSTVVLYLAVRAVGKNSVLPVTMPAREQDECIPRARLIRRALEFDQPSSLPYEINIQPIVQAHLQVMSHTVANLGASLPSQSLQQKLRSGNFANRARVAVLYDLQRAIRGRILGTGHRTAVYEGYFTKFGCPFSYDFGVLDELFKTDVYQLAAELGVPQEIMDAPSSPGYFAGQTAEADLGASWLEQDCFIYLLVDQNLSPTEVAHRYGANEQYSCAVLQRFALSEHKRRPLAHAEHAHLPRA